MGVPQGRWMVDFHMGKNKNRKRMMTRGTPMTSETTNMIRWVCQKPGT